MARDGRCIVVREGLGNGAGEGVVAQAQDAELGEQAQAGGQRAVEAVVIQANLLQLLGSTDRRRNGAREAVALEREEREPTQTEDAARYRALHVVVLEVERVELQ